MMAVDFDVNKLIAHLQGSCLSLQEGLSELYPEMETIDLTGDDFDKIENEIFLCETCGWWCELGDMSNDGENCNDCCVEEDEEY